ncbi:P1 family peptidase [Candidatus Dojkabacteria bacterium]|uniref:P1 family peptidase n=1 Tax=Candidatus Dojkabacteria bacterium TaxID=2099670 RepID=A0A955RIB2_9BACT|nr:P1 family peptidase [Candidatus Dojkabacteria bacterium]
MKVTSKVLSSLGLKIGHYTDSTNLTGTTVFISDNPMTVGIDLRGSNPATFNVASRQPKLTGSQVNSIVLTGGSTFGLGTCIGVLKQLEAIGVGSKTRAAIIPGVIGAVIYDLAVGSSNIRPGQEEGIKAVKDATYNSLVQGNIGVGTGATTGKWFNGVKIKGGFGMAYSKILNDIIVSAFVVTNAVGDIVNPKNGKFYAESGNYNASKNFQNIEDKELTGLIDIGPTNTTLAVIATNIELNREQLMKVSEIANDGMARAIYPVHTMMDGDAIFSVSTGSQQILKPELIYTTIVDIIGTTAADVLQEAIKNSVLNAESVEGYQSYKDKYK